MELHVGTEKSRVHKGRSGNTVIDDILFFKFCKHPEIYIIKLGYVNNATHNMYI